ncbi:SNF1-RELATED PROTEIN KINASE REGULATORY SUBUNIT BETA-1 [Salix purpurea]|uniref:SNF1-RELATED PROTEIN KINASE REGULATORY SUBUNIT BETA-1 n=1 Tax=Salix purpurea TaxID=77065 RepID=A0A9Q0WGT5_SALPP|nr:SNF1-RELATED PROTEIN KINASE REGULATORY SUBUNIT BETA-1 [Salix purpurea]
MGAFRLFQLQSVYLHSSSGKNNADDNSGSCHPLTSASFDFKFLQLSDPRLLLFISFIRDWERCKLDEFVLLTLHFAIFNMSNQYSEDPEEATVVGFEVPRSPDSSYNNVYPGNEDEVRDPPSVPPHLQHSLLSYPASADTSETLPLPQNVILNHLYIENREAPRSVVALGFTHRFHSKFVTVVLYKPVQRRGSTST